MQGTFLKLNKTRPFQLSPCVCVLERVCVLAKCVYGWVWGWDVGVFAFNKFD